MRSVLVVVWDECCKRLSPGQDGYVVDGKCYERERYESNGCDNALIHP